MERKELELKYLEHGRNNFQLDSVEDLLLIHGIDYQKVIGYSSLDELNRMKYKKFIVNYFNAQGMVERGTIVPLAIYYVEERGMYVEDGDMTCGVGCDVEIINVDGSTQSHSKERFLKGYEDKEIKQDLPIRYLRFEYNILKGDSIRGGWLHVYHDGREWG